MNSKNINSDPLFKKSERLIGQNKASKENKAFNSHSDNGNILEKDFSFDHKSDATLPERRKRRILATPDSSFASKLEEEEIAEVPYQHHRFYTLY